MRQPTPEEQQELIRLGAFPTEVPSWVAKTDAGSSRGNSGFIPTQFGAGSGIPGYQAQHSVDQERLEIEKARVARQLQTDTPEPSDKKVSPIDRITAACPVRENLIRDALLETDRAQRLGKYRALTGLCPQSYDLWLWLGKDHFSGHELIDAAYALEYAVSLSPDKSPEHAEALGLLKTVHSQMTGGTAPEQQAPAPPAEQVQ